MPPLRPTPLIALRHVNAAIAPAVTDPITDVSKVAVFDRGVHSPGASPFFQQLNVELTSEAGSSPDLDHGTSVVPPTTGTWPCCPVVEDSLLSAHRGDGDMGAYCKVMPPTKYESIPRLSRGRRRPLPFARVWITR